MKILILGGTKFLGRHLAETALASGHEVTLFNRGRTNNRLFPEIETLIGDRNGHLRVLKGRRWDAAIDTSGAVSAQVRDAASILSESVDLYTFISSISAYRDFAAVGLEEKSPLAELPPATLENENDGASYGARKALCEEAAQRILPGRALIVRPGLLAGPYDMTNRLAWWIHRMQRGGEVVCPGRPNAPLQLLDARDLASWIVRMAEERQAGTFNATGPVSTLGQALQVCNTVGGNKTSMVWMEDEFLLNQGLRPFEDFPFWIPETERSYAGFFSVRNAKAVAAGLTFRPLAETVRDVLAFNSNSGEHPRLSADREVAILSAWKQRHSSSPRRRIARQTHSFPKKQIADDFTLTTFPSR